MLDLHQVRPIALQRGLDRVDQRWMAMSTKSLAEVDCAAAVRVRRSLHKMDGVQAVEIGEATCVVKRRLVGNQHNVEIASQFAQQPVDAACAAVSRWKNTERGDEQHARSPSSCSQIGR